MDTLSRTLSDSRVEQPSSEPLTAWDLDRLKEAERWDLDAYPLWHDQMRMSEKMKLATPRKLLVRGEGCWVEDVEGRRYLDARAGICNVQLGYGRKDVIEAMHRQACELPFACVIRFDRPALTTLRYAAQLVQAAPSSLVRVRLTHMGSASTENALQMARLLYRNVGQPDKTWIISLEESYHGSTLMTLAASGEIFIPEILPAPPPDFAKVPKPSLESCPGCTGNPSLKGSCTRELEAALERIGPQRVAAVVVEPVMGNRIWPLTRHYLLRLRELADERDFLLIFDEIVTGFGRLGTLFAADHFNVEPDIMCLAKGITSGYAPMGAVLVTERVFAAFDIADKVHFPNGSSTDGHPVACAAAAATLTALTGEGVLDNVRRQGTRVLDGLRRNLGAKPFISEIRGVGLLIAIQLRGRDGRPVPLETTRKIESECDDRGVLVQHVYDVIELFPPLVISEREVDLMVGTVSEVINDVMTRSR